MMTREALPPLDLAIEKGVAVNLFVQAETHREMPWTQSLPDVASKGGLS